MLEESVESYNCRLESIEQTQAQLMEIIEMIEYNEDIQDEEEQKNNAIKIKRSSQLFLEYMGSSQKLTSKVESVYNDDQPMVISMTE